MEKQKLVAKVLAKLVKANKKVYIKPGEKGKAKMPSSEVCMHMKCSGKIMGFEFLPKGKSVQLLNENGSKFSFPILPSEAGIYSEGTKFYYYEE